jgi:hypothetical protein
MLDAARVLAQQQRRQLVADDRDDVAAMRAVVAVIDLADQPAGGAQAGDDRIAAGDAIPAAAERLAQRISTGIASTPSIRMD